MKYTKITASERKLIAAWLQQGVSNKEIGRRLGRHPTSVANEMKRNRFQRDIYEPMHAQAKAKKRQQHAWQAKHPLKNHDVYAYVLSHLRAGWSPEQIAGRLSLNHPDDPHWHICPETIYRFHLPQTEQAVPVVGILTAQAAAQTNAGRQKSPQNQNSGQNLDSPATGDR